MATCQPWWRVRSQISGTSPVMGNMCWFLKPQDPALVTVTFGDSMEMTNSGVDPFVAPRQSSAIDWRCGQYFTVTPAGAQVLPGGPLLLDVVDDVAGYVETQLHLRISVSSVLAIYVREAITDVDLENLQRLVGSRVPVFRAEIEGS
jgi:hypothetical protein